MATDMIEQERYARQTLLWGAQGQEKLAHARVSIVGADSHAVYTALCLASLGVGTIALIDGEKTVQDSFFLDHPITHSHRALGYAAHINQVNPQISMEGYPTSMTSRVDQEVLCGSTVIIDATNSIRSKELSIAYGREHRIPVLSTSSRWGYTKLMYCSPDADNDAFLMPMFEGHRQSEIMSLALCGIIAEETRKLIFNENTLLRAPVRLTLGPQYRYDHPQSHEELPLPDPTKYSSVKVAFLGAGALGCWGALSAVSMGLGRVDVYDYDTFESHNINRQVLGYDGIDQLKAVHIASKIKRMSRRKTASTGYNVKIGPGFETETQYDVVFDFVDNLYTRAINTAYAMTHKIPMISAASDPYSARWISQVDDTTQCLDCLYNVYQRGREEEMIRRASCAANPNPSVVMSNAIAASMALLELYSLIEPEKFGNPFNGEQTYRATNPKRFGTSPLNDPCSCYQTQIPDLAISDEQVKTFAQEHPEALRRETDG